MPYLNETHATGWLQDTEDRRDWGFGYLLDEEGTPDLPASVDLSEHLSTVLYQGSAPSCVGHAVAHQIMIEESIAGVRDSIPSRAFIYAMARMRHQLELELTGTYPRNAYKAVREIGCPPEHWWKYDTRGDWLCKKPNYQAKRWGASRIGLEYYRISGDVSDQIRQALANNHPVAFGTYVTEHMENYRSGEIVHPPFLGQEVGGGHYMLIVGYEKDCFHIVNSWRGTEHMLFSEDLIEHEYSSDFYVITGWDAIK